MQNPARTEEPRGRREDDPRPPAEAVTTPFRELFREAFDDHYGSIFRYLDRLSGDPDLAADIAQEAFVRLYRRGSLPDSPGRWLVTVALNLFRNRATKRSRRRELELERAPDIRPGAGPSPLGATEAVERRARVRAALDRLSERDRQLLLLQAEGYGYRDLARILELNESSVGTFLARARRSFVQAWEAP